MIYSHLPLSEPIDLLNVAFENPRTLEAKAQTSSKQKRKRPGKEVEAQNSEVEKAKRYLVPDRVTGLAQVDEFRRLAPERTWNFVGRFQ
jgi:hypothetical protein